MYRLAVVTLLFLAAQIASATPVHLQCEALTNPLGIDAEKPSFAWRTESNERNWRQSAYQILVASKPDLITSGKSDIWDSGKVASSESTSILYTGPALESRKRYYWTVRVWDARGHVSQASEPAWWETGVLARSDWKAQWIRWQNPEEEADETNLKWVWVQGQDALHVLPKTVAVFRVNFDLNEIPNRAALFLIAHGDWKVSVNGHDAGAKANWNEFDRREIGGFLIKGNNTIDVTVTIPPPEPFGPNAGAPNAPRPGALAALLKIRHRDGAVERIPTGDRWQARLLADQQWAPAVVAGNLDDKRFGSEPGALPQPAGLLRTLFSIAKPVQSARAYVTALGSYEMYINGQRLGTGILTPGFTEFEKRIRYQTYDVTNLLTQGPNAVGAILASGWFGSGISWSGVHFKLLPPTRLLAQIDITYTDGTHQLIASDGSWKAAESPILHSEIYAGETYDARLEKPGWNKPGFDDSSWTPAVITDPYTGQLSSQVDLPPQIVSTVKPEHISKASDGSYVVDMGQNMVGWIALNAHGQAGQTVRLRFAEILNPDGTIYTTNLRNADATDTFTLRGGADETFQPRFTFHGFRYVELTGYPGALTAADVTGQVVSSLSAEPTAHLTTSSNLVNRMWTIGIWGQRGNFLSVPTDCPQRDERLGWMGDAGVFWRTGTYNFDIDAFTHKWMADVDDAQLPDGAFTNVSPNIGLGDVDGAPGWGDAGVIVPYTTWLQYGDKTVIERNWESMNRWMNFIQDANPDYVRKNKLGPNFGDWLAPDPTTSRELVATAYWALIARQMSEMARAVGKESEATTYSDLYSKIRTAFQGAYVKSDGTVGSGSQTSYVVALYADLLPPELTAPAIKNLAANIDSHAGHLTTGFLGTPFLLFALSNHGRTDLAYKLLLTETYPSWGYMLSKGATTWWERWNGDTGDPAMNSYNHYAFGSVVAWVYRSVVGIDTLPAGPGFHQIVIHPHPDALMSEASGDYDSAYGKITTQWHSDATNNFTLKVTIPPNTTARVVLPKLAHAHVRENGHSVKSTEEAGNLIVEIGSGSYDFAVN